MPRTSQKPTIRQVALACKVSPRTVSAVLNNKSSEVGKETRERVLKAVRELGYRPTAANLPIGGRQVPIYGVVTATPGCSLVRPGYYSAILGGILARVFQFGHNVLLFSNDAFHADVQQSIRLYCDGRCDGLLIIAPPLGSPLVQAVWERGLPFVIIGSTGGAVDLPAVDVDNFSEAYRMVEYLITLGHRRIAFVGDPSCGAGDADFPDSALQRRQGYEQALAAHGIMLNSAYETHIGPDDERSYPQAVGLLRLPPSERPTALFCWHDAAALNVYRAVQDVGLRIPEDVSVVGFDDDPVIAGLNPALTTVRQPYLQIGATAVEMLTEQLQAEQTRPEQAQDHGLSQGRRFLPAKIIVRRSVAFPLPNERTDSQSEPHR